MMTSHAPSTSMMGGACLAMFLQFICCLVKDRPQLLTEATPVSVEVEEYHSFGVWRGVRRGVVRCEEGWCGEVWRGVRRGVERCEEGCGGVVWCGEV